VITAKEFAELATLIGLQWQACFKAVETCGEQFIQGGCMAGGEAPQGTKNV